MRILIGSPVTLGAVAGPATVARELSRSFESLGDQTEFVTFSPFEKSLPPVLRQLAFFFRSFARCARADAILLLDPASTGPSLALAAKILRRRCVLRVGGDFLWETYVERTSQALLLSEFYTMPRKLSIRERIIRRGTHLTLSLVSEIIFTTDWQRAIWYKPYSLEGLKSQVISPVLPARDIYPATGTIFLSATRGSHIKNSEVMKLAWESVAKKHPEAILDSMQRKPEEYAQRIRECYVVVVPSLSEVSPNAVLEAVHYGKPFITTGDCGLKEELQHLGNFVDTRDPNAIAKAVESMLEPAQYQAILKRIQEFQTIRTWEDVARQFRKALVS